MNHLSFADAHSLPSSRLSFELCPEQGPEQGPEQEPKPAWLDELARALSELGKDGSVEQAVEMGRLVIERLYGGDLSAWRGRGPKAHSLRALARRSDLPVSSSALYRSIALYELSLRLGGVERWTAMGLGISHLRQVLGLPSAKQRRLLDSAARNSWTVAELERAAVAVRERSPERGSRGGRPRLPRFVKSVNRLRKATEEMFGDLDAAADMSPERLTELRDVLSTIRVRCAELDRALERASAAD
ncbi:hypothetical protein ENSA5_40600 [Enhygromyxa salina]|uniref:Uncharacterized protein n=1 Tax=Enhygromyxa salina TaxID=215803 RepID=A0A2S9XPE1_9BACT|nr:hypothetical protein [Enhygromyxa salina]PRP94737.1 hypothetical protein ENSA5_40600 [Enhygromyxa salina]